VQAHAATTHSGIVVWIFLVPEIDLEAKLFDIETHGCLNIADVENRYHVFQLGGWHAFLRVVT
jgi:hypothetical protein